MKKKRIIFARLLIQVFLSFRKSSSFELYTQDARAEMIKEQHDGNPMFDHKMWMFKPLR